MIMMTMMIMVYLV